MRFEKEKITSGNDDMDLMDVLIHRARMGEPIYIGSPADEATVRFVEKIVETVSAESDISAQIVQIVSLEPSVQMPLVDS